MALLWVGITLLLLLLLLHGLPIRPISGTGHMQMQQECLCCRAHVHLNGFITQCGYVNRQQWHYSPGHYYSINRECPHALPFKYTGLFHKAVCNKRAIKAKINTFGFWFSTFYSNKRVMQLSGMRLSGLYCTAFHSFCYVTLLWVSRSCNGFVCSRHHQRGLQQLLLLLLVCVV